MYYNIFNLQIIFKFIFDKMPKARSRAASGSLKKNHPDSVRIGMAVGLKNKQRIKFK
jgi:hypothetical protein